MADPVPMLTLKYSGMRALGREMFPDEVNSSFAFYGMAEAYETKTHPTTVRRHTFDEVANSVGHTFLYVTRAQCRDQERRHLSDTHVDMTPVRMCICFLPMEGQENVKPGSPGEQGRVYMVREMDVLFHAAAEVPAIIEERGHEGDPAWHRYVKHIREEVYPKAQESAIHISITPTAEKVDVKFAVELGMGIMLDKPIISLIRPGTPVSEKLARVVDRFVDMDPNDMKDTSRRLAAAIKEVAVELKIEFNETQEDDG